MTVMSKKRQELGPTALQVAKNVRRLRKQQGMSSADLVRATGGYLSLDAVRKIEAAANPEASVVRRVSTDELMVLAHALNASPTALLLGTPDHANDTVEITGTGETTAEQAWAWATGDSPLPPRETEGPGEAHVRRTLFGLNSRPWWWAQVK